MLTASEAAIYGRFGYGVATRMAKVSIDTARGLPLRAEPAAGGRLRLVTDTGAARRRLSAPVYDAVRRNGWASCPEPDGVVGRCSSSTGRSRATGLGPVLRGARGRRRQGRRLLLVPGQGGLGSTTPCLAARSRSGTWPRRSRGRGGAARLPRASMDLTAFDHDVDPAGRRSLGRAAAGRRPPATASSSCHDHLYVRAARRARGAGGPRLRGAPARSSSASTTRSGRRPAGASGRVADDGKAPANGWATCTTATPTPPRRRRPRLPVPRRRHRPAAGRPPAGCGRRRTTRSPASTGSFRNGPGALLHDAVLSRRLLNGWRRRRPSASLRHRTARGTTRATMKTPMAAHSQPMPASATSTAPAAAANTAPPPTMARAR